MTCSLLSLHPLSRCTFRSCGNCWGDGCGVTEWDWLITALSEQLGFHAGLSKWSKLLSVVLLPCICFVLLLLHPLSLLVWYIQPKLFGIRSESACLCKPYSVSLSNQRWVSLLGLFSLRPLQLLFHAWVSRDKSETSWIALPDVSYRVLLNLISLS